MSVTFLIGAIIGSGVALMFGRDPAHRLLARIRTRTDRSRPPR